MKQVVEFDSQLSSQDGEFRWVFQRAKGTKEARLRVGETIPDWEHRMLTPVIPDEYKNSNVWASQMTQEPTGINNSYTIPEIPYQMYPGYKPKTRPKIHTESQLDAMCTQELMMLEPFGPERLALEKKHLEAEKERQRPEAVKNCLMQKNTVRITTQKK